VDVCPDGKKGAFRNAFKEVAKGSPVPFLEFYQLYFLGRDNGESVYEEPVNMIDL
jgi:hypothetical protein